MSRIPRLLLPWAATALLAGGCASLSEKQCLVGDWRSVGLADGLAGHAPPRLLDHRLACADHGVAVDEAAWRAGYDEGIARFCTPLSGFRVGERGAAFPSVCPLEQEAEFHAAWLAGRELFVFADRVRALRSELARTEQELERARQDRTTLVADLVRGELDPVARAEAATRIVTLSQEAGRLEEREQVLRRDLGRAEAEYEAARRASPWTA
ncbi:MAG: DUF2799 domain-containing protein [Pseudomonadales bacterium]|jgi:hypothetical protein|nr:DUF2799 domain-containing protein [Pseudomonadales bacterium]